MTHHLNKRNMHAGNYEKRKVLKRNHLFLVNRDSHTYKENRKKHRKDRCNGTFTAALVSPLYQCPLNKRANTTPIHRQPCGLILTMSSILNDPLMDNNHLIRLSEINLPLSHTASILHVPRIVERINNKRFLVTLFL